MNNTEVSEASAEDASNSDVNLIIKLFSLVPLKYQSGLAILSILIILFSSLAKFGSPIIKYFSNEKGNTDYQRAEKYTKECMSDPICHASILNEKLGLFTVEKLVNYSDLKYSEKSFINEEESYLEKNSIVLEKTILNKHGFFHEKDYSVSTDTDTIYSTAEEPEFIENTDLTANTGEKVVIEFANDARVPKGNAATCNPGKFYEKRLKLLNANTGQKVEVVTSYPLDCNSEEQNSSCTGYPKIQISFSTASKLYPELYNPIERKNILPKCSSALVNVIEEL